MYLTDNGPQMIQRSENMELQMFPQKAFMIESHAGSWQHPYPFQRRWWAQNNFYQEPAENVEKLATGGGGSCSSPRLLSRPHPDYGRAAHWGLGCPALPRQGRPVPQVPIPQENLLDILGLAAKDWCYPGTSAHNDHEEIWGSSLYLA